MMRCRCLPLAVCVALLWAPAIFAAEPATAPTTAPSATPAAAPTAAIEVNNKAAITAAMDTDATVVGTVESAKWSSSGKVMLVKFADVPDTKLTAVLFSKSKDEFDKAFGGDTAAAFTGAKIRIKGQLKLWSKKDGKEKLPEIVIGQAADAAIVTPAPAAATAPANTPAVEDPR